jgi:nucleotide-binding universal stress UspA family protein
MVALDRLTRRGNHARQLARRSFAPHRTIVVPLLGHEESEHAVSLACRLAAERNGRVLFLAPLEVPPELPLDARFEEEEQRLKERLGRVRAHAESYGIAARARILRTRNFGLDVANEADRVDADLIVVGTPICSRRGFAHTFPEPVERILRHASARVLISTGDVVGADGRAAA